MNCEKINEKLIAYKYNELSANEMLKVKDHLESCENCKKILEKDDYLDELLHENRKEFRLSDDFSVNLKDAIKPKKSYFVSMAASVIFFFVVGSFMAYNSVDTYSEEISYFEFGQESIYSSTETIQN